MFNIDKKEFEDIRNFYIKKNIISEVENKIITNYDRNWDYMMTKDGKILVKRKNTDKWITPNEKQQKIIARKVFKIDDVKEPNNKKTSALIDTDSNPNWDYKSQDGIYLTKQKEEDHWSIPKSRVQKKIGTYIFKHDEADMDVEKINDFSKVYAGMIAPPEFQGDVFPKPGVLKRGTIEKIKRGEINVRQKFDDLFDSVYEKYVTNIEGNYYHPDMKRKNGKKFSSMGDSGETMFGIDRKYFGKPENPSIYNKFWRIIDNHKKENGGIGYNQTLDNGGPKDQELKKLSKEIIKNRAIRMNEVNYKQTLKVLLRNIKGPNIENKFKYYVFGNDQVVSLLIISTWSGYGHNDNYYTILREYFQNNKSIYDALDAILAKRSKNTVMASTLPKVKKIINSFDGQETLLA